MGTSRRNLLKGLCGVPLLGGLKVEAKEDAKPEVKLETIKLDNYLDQTFSTGLVGYDRASEGGLRAGRPFHIQNQNANENSFRFIRNKMFLSIELKHFARRFKLNKFKSPIYGIVVGTNCNETVKSIVEVDRSMSGHQSLQFHRIYADIYNLVVKNQVGLLLMTDYDVLPKVADFYSSFIVNVMDVNVWKIIKSRHSSSYHSFDPWL